MMVKNIFKSFINSYLSILPIVVIVILFCCAYNVDTNMFFSFIFSSFLIAIGMSLFTYGADNSMIPMGKSIGNRLVKTRKLGLILLILLFIGIFITISEPNLRVLAVKISSIPLNTFLIVVATGVGLFLTLSAARTLFKIDYTILLFIFIGMIMVLLLFVPSNFISLAFDAGGVTMGCISAPFVIALGVGLASMRNDREAKQDSFGLTGLCAIGPTLMILLLGLFCKLGKLDYISNISNSNIMQQYLKEFRSSFLDIFISLIPIIIIYMVYVLSKLGSEKDNKKIIIGLLFTLAGLTIFMTGANIGFMDMGYIFGYSIASSKFLYVLIPLSMVLGYFLVLAEPTTKLLNNQIEELTSGSIKKSMMGLVLSIGVAIAVGLGIARIIFEINIFYIIIPLYMIALILSLFTPRMFTSIAFDTGGVVAGALTTTFLLSLSIGVCVALNRDYLTYGFGLVSIVTLVPRITVELLGILFKVRNVNFIDVSSVDESIIEYDWDV